jgi:hypothetical protein
MTDPESHLHCLDFTTSQNQLSGWLRLVSTGVACSNLKVHWQRHLTSSSPCSTLKICHVAAGDTNTFKFKLRWLQLCRAWPRTLPLCCSLSLLRSLPISNMLLPLLPSEALFVHLPQVLPAAECSSQCHASHTDASRVSERVFLFRTSETVGHPCGRWTVVVRTGHDCTSPSSCTTTATIQSLLSRRHDSTTGTHTHTHTC